MNSYNIILLYMVWSESEIFSILPSVLILLPLKLRGTNKRTDIHMDILPCILSYHAQIYKIIRGILDKNLAQNDLKISREVLN